MNNVCLVGRLTRDPELRTTSSGLSNCRFTLAVDGRQNSEGKIHTDFINIVVWKNQAENVSKYCKKGSLVGITGRIQTGSYEAQDGSTKYTMDVIADTIKFLSTKSNSNSENIESEESVADISKSVVSDEVILTDDDLPF